MSATTDYDQLREKPSSFCEAILGVEPFSYQKRILDADTRHRCIVSGRQVGKSRLCAWLALHKALTEPYIKVLITAPSLRQSSLLFDTLQSEIDQSALSSDQWGIDRDTQTIIEFDNGSSIHCLPTGRDGNKIRGFTADMVIVDEAAFIDDQIFGDILQPMLFASGGSMILASTPMGKSGFLYEKFQAAKHKDGWKRIQVSSYDNPIVDENDIDEYRQGKTEAQIEREVYGRFVADAGQFFPSDAISDCMTETDPSQESNHTYLGVDIAGTGDDRTVFYGIDEQGNVFLNDEIYGSMGVLEAADYIKTLDGIHNFDRIFVDRTAIGQGTIEALADDPTIERKHEPIYFTIQRKQQIYQRLKAGLESGGLNLPNNKTLQDELESIAADETNAGNLRLYPRGENAKDDLVDALALACWGLPEFGDQTYSRGASKSVTPSKGTDNEVSASGRVTTKNRATSKTSVSQSYSVNTGNGSASNAKDRRRRNKNRSRTNRRRRRR